MTNFELIEILRTEEAHLTLKDAAQAELLKRIESFDCVRQLYTPKEENPY
ncbi:MAG: hypothetical protein ACXABY_10625 [Candidatus Thorarchaeota archaeon]|jgi:hypothetical protein